LYEGAPATAHSSVLVFIPAARLMFQDETTGMNKTEKVAFINARGKKVSPLQFCMKTSGINVVSGFLCDF